jgi:hypothetical protein
MKRDDFYTSEFRAGIQRSMSEPWKPLNVREPKSYIPLPRVERRTRHLARFWFNYHKDIGRFLWSLVFIVVAAEAILIYGIR